MRRALHFRHKCFANVAIPIPAFAVAVQLRNFVLSMTETPLVTRPVFSPDVTIDVDFQQLEERTTIVHCTLVEDSFIRIWPSTYLVQQNGVRKQLVQAFGIASFPDWGLAQAGHRFTLVFEGLDRDCPTFTLLEEIPEPGGLMIGPLSRNGSDVYWLEVSE